MFDWLIYQCTYKQSSWDKQFKLLIYIQEYKQMENGNGNKMKK